MRQSQDELARSQDRVRSLQTELDQAWERQREAEAVGQQLKDAQGERDQLRARAEALAVRAADADRMQDALRSGRVEISRLRGQIRTFQQAAASSAKELEAVGLERDRLREEVDQVRAQREASLAAAGSQGPLAEEWEALWAERDRLRAEQRTMTEEVERLRAQLSTREQELAEGAAARDAREGEMQRLRQEVETLRQERPAVARPNDDLGREEESVPAPGTGPATPHQQAEQRFQAAVARFTELVDQIQSLRAELGQQQERPGERKGTRGWLWSGSSSGGELREDEALYRRLDALRAEAITHQEAAAAAAAAAVRADLERQLAETRSRLKEAAERASRLEAELREYRGRSTPRPTPGLSPFR
jgi:hypothetical protein